ncbi:MAG: hypothetical protein A3G34_04095 [Candidatus Lindowbacteria bacterium RIFCSPLOWO2_12_FULL_62_27]|nr:MAG: hypothetical protein A3G34_04095 [Candidatus Lindowbacteria bacterium RIFCSPLOWO2_12_FULL_62_27]OGH63630.1 MAG: hypothetical protein A3I06_14235 [Candidatus Lindowbacteria bacterium RIFCSPLOWO2_02_FULL_62_12]
MNPGRNERCPCGSGKKYKKCCIDNPKASWRKPAAEPVSTPVRAADRDDDEFEDEEDEMETGEDAESDDEMAGVSRGTKSRFERIRYPEPDASLPKISPEDERIVDQWWIDFKPVYKGSDRGEMTKRIADFMDAHPGLFVHLRLDDEALFELGAMYGRKQEWNIFVDLLNRIRQEHPRAYLRAFGYCDSYIIAHLLASGRNNEIPEYLKNFKTYPDTDPDDLRRVIDMLALADMTEVLGDLIEAVAIPLCQSSKIINSGFAFRWVIFRRMIPRLDRKSYPEDDARLIVDELNALHPPFDFDPGTFRRTLACYAAPPDFRDIKLMRMEKLFEIYIHVVCHFCAWLHEKRSMGWIRARFLADRLEEYLLDIPSGKRPKTPFRFSDERMERHISTHYKWIVSIHGVPAMAFLHAVFLFSEYLLEAGYHDRAECGRIQSECLNVLDRCKKVCDPTDPAARLYTHFPHLAAGSPPAGVR